MGEAGVRLIRKRIDVSQQRQRRIIIVAVTGGMPSGAVGPWSTLQSDVNPSGKLMGGHNREWGVLSRGEDELATLSGRKFLFETDERGAGKGYLPRGKKEGHFRADGGTVVASGAIFERPEPESRGRIYTNRLVELGAGNAVRLSHGMFKR